MEQQGGSGRYENVVRSILADAGSQAIGKIEPIKRVREVTGLGLKDAKEAVESHYQRHPGTQPQASRPGCAGGTALFALTSGAVLAELWR